MYNPDGQYISVTKQSTNLNIEYQKLKNKNIDLANRSTFRIGDSDFMGEDVLFKLQSLQKDVPHTYITAFVEDETQFISPKENVVENHFISKKLNDDINIAVDKNKLFELSHYYEKTGIDYILSPFSVLNEHNIQNPESNTLIILIYNNKLYALVVDGFAKIIFSKVLPIIEFEDIQNSEFYEDPVMKQNLYDEVYQLELTNNIKSIMSEFYEGKHDIFIEKINILYTVKQLQNEQIIKIQNELMLKIDYHPISMDEVVFEMIKTKDMKDINFSTPREVKTKSNQSYMIILAILVVVAAIYYLISSQTQKEENEKLAKKKQTITQEVKTKKEVQDETPKVSITLPNHIEKNIIIEDLTNSLLGTIPYDMVLHKVEIKRDTSMMYGSLITKDLYAKSLQNDLLKLYDRSSIQFIDENTSKGEFKAIITNEAPKRLDIQFDPIKYDDKMFLTKTQIDSILNESLPKDASLIYDSLFKSEIMTFNYKVILKNSSPKTFVETIKKLNQLSNSIHINYPIVFEIKKSGLEISFNIQVHQYK